MVTSFSHCNDVTDQRAASMRMFVYYFSTGLERVCEIKSVHRECEGDIEQIRPGDHRLASQAC